MRIERNLMAKETTWRLGGDCRMVHLAAYGMDSAPPDGIAAYLTVTNCDGRTEIGIEAFVLRQIGEALIAAADHYEDTRADVRRETRQARTDWQSGETTSLRDFAAQEGIDLDAEDD